MRSNTVTALLLPIVFGVAVYGVGSLAADGEHADAAASGRPTDAASTTTTIRAAETPEPIRTSLDPDLRVTGADATELAALDDAVASFRAAGLSLPDLDVEFFDDATDCRGHEGLFMSGTDPWRVSICSDLAFVIPHELAHAWSAAHLDDADRDAYSASRGLPAWTGDHLEWGERGVEDAAFIIQQNLRDTSAPADSPAWTERMDAYEQLTGRTSPLRRNDA